MSAVGKGSGTLRDRKQGRIAELEAKIERLEADVECYQQREDEIIVALGSLGLLPSEIVPTIKRLEAVVDAAKKLNQVMQIDCHDIDDATATAEDDLELAIAALNGEQHE
jgi:hypothetical protein